MPGIIILHNVEIEPKGHKLTDSSCGRGGQPCDDKLPMTIYDKILIITTQETKLHPKKSHQYIFKQCPKNIGRKMITIEK